MVGALFSYHTAHVMRKSIVGFVHIFKDDWPNANQCFNKRCYSNLKSVSLGQYFFQEVEDHVASQSVRSFVLLYCLPWIWSGKSRNASETLFLKRHPIIIPQGHPIISGLLRSADRPRQIPSLYVWSDLSALGPLILSQDYHWSTLSEQDRFR